MAGFYGRAGIEIRDELTGKIEMMKSYVAEASYYAALAGGDVIAESYREKIPVSPGVVGHGRDGSHAKDHIEVQVYREGVGASARVGIFDTAIIPYAPHIEFGPHGRPALREAVDETREKVHKVMQDTFTSQLMGGFDIKTAVRFRGRA